MKIAILGGTGKEGSGLGFRWAAAGHEVIIGSRSDEKGIQAAAELQAALPSGVIRGCDNVTAADEAEIVVLSVPYEAQQATLTDEMCIRDRVTTSNPSSKRAKRGPTSSSCQP